MSATKRSGRGRPAKRHIQIVHERRILQYFFADMTDVDISLGMGSDITSTLCAVLRFYCVRRRGGSTVRPLAPTVTECTVRYLLFVVHLLRVLDSEQHAAAAVRTRIHDAQTHRTQPAARLEDPPSSPCPLQPQSCVRAKPSEDTRARRTAASAACCCWGCGAILYVHSDKDRDRWIFLLLQARTPVVRIWGAVSCRSSHKPILGEDAPV
ncbi:hypothetical protein GY45DRAFT_870947 [Cubamyces sp. BRFM 1775]|nr:hypothetical protein GY45DRAFT_870947 [Cubamyces sp. BRFM 1775]